MRYIENPTSSISILQNIPLSYKGSGLTRYDVVQIMPQMMSLSLRPGEHSQHSKYVSQGPILKMQRFGP